MRRDLARLLDSLYGLHVRPGHLDVVLEVIALHSPVKAPVSPLQAQEWRPIDPAACSHPRIAYMNTTGGGVCIDCRAYIRDEDVPEETKRAVNDAIKAASAGEPKERQPVEAVKELALIPSWVPLRTPPVVVVPTRCRPRQDVAALTRWTAPRRPSAIRQWRQRVEQETCEHDFETHSTTYPHVEVCRRCRKAECSSCGSELSDIFDTTKSQSP